MYDNQLILSGNPVHRPPIVICLPITLIDEAVSLV